MKLSAYQASGFYCLDKVGPGGLRSAPAAVVAITKGQILTDDTTGYATNTATDFGASNLLVGVAAEPCANSAGSKGDLDVLYYPPLPNYQFSVPVDNALITRTSVGTYADIGTANGAISTDDVPTEGWGFKIDDIDVSAEALDGNQYGYAIGHFEMIGTAA